MPAVFKIKTHDVYVDTEDADLFTNKWYAAYAGLPLPYVVRNVRLPSGKRATQKLHRVVMERMIGRSLKSNELVDHKDRNPLNNTRHNLRLATSSQNQANRKVMSSSSLQLKGVRQRPSGRFSAQIFKCGKIVWLGTYDTAEEAHAVYVEAAKSIHGEFARGE